LALQRLRHDIIQRCAIAFDPNVLEKPFEHPSSPDIFSGAGIREQAPVLLRPARLEQEDGQGVAVHGRECA
jgi:hypothetical protein